MELIIINIRKIWLNHPILDFMHAKTAIAVLVLLLSHVTWSQTVLHGKVLDQDTHEPLEMAVVTDLHTDRQYLTTSTSPGPASPASPKAAITSPSPLPLPARPDSISARRGAGTAASAIAICTIAQPTKTTPLLPLAILSPTLP
jgi:hypothetical protein